MKYKKFLLFAVAAFVSGFAISQQKKDGIITGTIKDAKTKSPLTEAVITISSTALAGQKFVLTDSAGTYKINKLPEGSYTIVFEMEGYQKYVQDSITLKDETAVSINHEMVKEQKKSKKNQVQMTSYKQE